MIEPDLLSESQGKKAIVDDYIYGNLESVEKCLLMDDFLCTADYYNQEVDYSILRDDAPQLLEVEAKYEAVDMMPQIVDDARDLHLTWNFSSLCNDYLLDSGYKEGSMLGSPSNSELKRSEPEYQSEFIKRNDNASEISKSLNAANPLVEYTSNQLVSFLETMDDQELLDGFRSIFGRDTCVTDKQWLKHQILFGLQNFGKFYNLSGIAESGLPSIEDEGNALLIPGSNICDRVTDVQDRSLMFSRGIGRDGQLGKHYQKAISEVTRLGPGLGLSSSTIAGTVLISSKRLRKPPRRYIEEMSEMKSGSPNKRLKAHAISSRYKLHDRTVRHHLWEGDSTLMHQECHVGRHHSRKIISVEDCSRAQHMLLVVSPKRTFSLQQSGSESPDEVSDDTTTEIKNKKIGTRRKHHKQWMLPEVIKLVDGVSKYGIGRWSEIKRELFQSSAFRTSVDLKDKWRNLLKASEVQLCHRNKGRVCKFPIPRYILQHVRELSVLHPYPTGQTSRLSSMTASSSVANGER